MTEPADPQPLVDAKVLDELADATSPQIVGELLAMFLRNLPGVIMSLREAVAAADAQALRALAHPQASVCQTLGMPRLARIARQLESLADAGDPASAAPLLDDLERLRVPVEAELRRLGRLGPAHAIK